MENPAGRSVEQMNQLAQAFQLFNETTGQLRQAYQQLEERVAELNQELEEANRKLTSKVDELNQTKDYLDNSLDSMTDGLLTVDLEGRITRFNRAASQITLLEEREVLGQDAASLFGKDFGVDAIPTRKAQRRRHEAGEIRRKDGSAVPVSISTAPLRDRDGSVIGALRVFQDLTEVTRLREEVRRKDRLAALGEMAATVAHEIRNPLGGIEGFASLLKRDLDPADPKSKLVQKVLDGTRSLNSVVSEFLMFARPMKFQFKPTSPRLAIEKTLSFIAPQLSEKSITVKQNIAEGLPEISSDSEKLYQALLNIILNAIQSMEKGGVLAIAASCVPKEGGEGETSVLAISISDTGCGIKEDDLSKIFEPFFTTKEKGTGLGLAVAARIIEEHGGQVHVQSRKGEGTRFEIELPCLPETAT